MTYVHGSLTRLVCCVGQSQKQRGPRRCFLVTGLVRTVYQDGLALIAARHRRGELQSRHDLFMPEVSINAVTELDDATYRSVCVLLPQLSASAKTPTFDELSQVANCPCTKLVVARISGNVIGMLTLVLIRIPTKVTAHIEDVVVDESTRGLGIGRKLTAHALRLATEAGARHVDLTSRPSRVEANRLYESLGFVRRDSNVLRYSISR